MVYLNMLKALLVIHLFLFLFFQMNKSSSIQLNGIEIRDHRCFGALNQKRNTILMKLIDLILFE